MADKKANPFEAPSFLSGTGTSAIPGSVQNPSGLSYGTVGTGLPPIKHESGDSALVPGTGGAPSTGHVFSDTFSTMTDTLVPGPGMSLYEAKQDLIARALQDPQSALALQQQLIDAGVLDPRSRAYHPGMISVDDATYKAWLYVARMSIAQNKPFGELLDGLSSQKLGSKFETEVKSSTATRVDLSNPTEVQGLLTMSMKQILGRAPTPNELQGAIASLNQLQRANPTVAATSTTMHNTWDNGQLAASDATDQSSTQSGGMDTGVAMDNYVRSNFTQEADKHAINSYVDAFASMLGGG